MEEACYVYYDAEDRIIGCIKTRFPNRILAILELATEHEVRMEKMRYSSDNCGLSCPHHLDKVRTDSIINDYDEKKFNVNGNLSVCHDSNGADQSERPCGSGLLPW